MALAYKIMSLPLASRMPLCNLIINGVRDETRRMSWTLLAKTFSYNYNDYVLLL